VDGTIVFVCLTVRDEGESSVAESTWSNFLFVELVSEVENYRCKVDCVPGVGRAGFPCS
jgi:hypothetical protein